LKSAPVSTHKRCSIGSRLLDQIGQLVRPLFTTVAAARSFTGRKGRAAALPEKIIPELAGVPAFGIHRS
jgi:hypothetical protein